MLISSHITSDLEKIADYIVLLHKGRVAFEKSRDELITVTVYCAAAANSSRR